MEIQKLNRKSKNFNADLFQKRIVVWDTETTGKYTKKGDRMIQFSGIEIIDGKITQFYETKLKPISYDANGKPYVKQIDNEAFNVHKISNQDLENEKTFAEKQQEIIDFMSGAVCIAHNERFDIGFLNSELALANSNLRFKDFVTEHYDTYLLSRAFDSSVSTHGLDKIVQRYFKEGFAEVLEIQEWNNNQNIRKVDLGVRVNKDEEYSRHDALIDCAVLGKFILHIFKEKWDLSLLKDFKEKEAPIDFQPFTLPENYQPVIARNTTEELKIEKDYIELFKPKEERKSGLKP